MTSTNSTAERGDAERAEAQKSAGSPGEKRRGSASGGDSGGESRPLTTMVRERIERMVMSGELKAGERLNENALAVELNVSRGPVREATRALAEAGLLTIMRNRGVFVRNISLEDVLHVYDIRAGLARVAGRLAALRASESGITLLRKLWEGMETARIARDSDTYYDINREFHARIVEMTGNPRLIEIHEQSEREVFLFLRRGVTGPTRIDISNQQHKEMLDAIAAGDELEAARAFERHVVAGKQRMLDTIVSSPTG